jgi:hypothetical protein
LNQQTSTSRAATSLRLTKFVSLFGSFNFVAYLWLDWLNIGWLNYLWHDEWQSFLSIFLKVILHYWLSSCDLIFIYIVPVFIWLRKKQNGAHLFWSENLPCAHFDEKFYPVFILTRNSTLFPFWHSSDLHVIQTVPVFTVAQKTDPTTSILIRKSTCAPFEQKMYHVLLLT